MAGQLELFGNRSSSPPHVNIRDTALAYRLFSGRNVIRDSASWACCETSEGLAERRVPGARQGDRPEYCSETAAKAQPRRCAFGAADTVLSGVQVVSVHDIARALGR